MGGLVSYASVNPNAKLYEYSRAAEYSITELAGAEAVLAEWTVSLNPDPPARTDVTLPIGVQVYTEMVRDSGIGSVNMEFARWDGTFWNTIASPLDPTTTSFTRQDKFVTSAAMFANDTKLGVIVWVSAGTLGRIKNIKVLFNVWLQPGMTIVRTV